LTNAKERENQTKVDIMNHVKK